MVDGNISIGSESPHVKGLGYLFAARRGVSRVDVPAPPRHLLSPASPIEINANLSPKSLMVGRESGSFVRRDMTSCMHRTDDHEKLAHSIRAALDRGQADRHGRDRAQRE